MSIDKDIYRLPVVGNDIRVRFYEGKSFNVARKCVDCSVITAESAAKARCVSLEGAVQLTLLDSNQHRQPEIGARDKDIVADELSSRAQAGIDGSCKFIEQVPGCWRRYEVE